MKVACGIVFYNPSKQDIDNILKYISYFEKVYIFDNSEYEDTGVDCFGENVIKIKNNGNNGLSIAYDKMAKSAIKDGFDYLITLDQDSKLEISTIYKMINSVINNYTENDKIGIFCPKVFYQKKWEYLSKIDKYVEWCISSGSMINLSIYEKKVSFDRNYFIDRVDKDFCKQVIDNGYHICQVAGTELIQQLGQTRKIFGLSFSYHSATRHYYIARNRLYYNKKYGIAPLITFLQLIKHLLRVFIIEDDKLKKFKMIFKGVSDYHNNVMGKGGF